jgi:hypothetical protein
VIEFADEHFFILSILGHDDTSDHSVSLSNNARW